VWTKGEGKHIKEKEETRTSMVKEMEEAQACVSVGAGPTDNYQKQPSAQKTTVKNNFIVVCTTGHNRLSCRHQVYLSEGKTYKT
jgi:hypothetical protein